MNIDIYHLHTVRGATITPDVRVDVEFDEGASRDNGCHVEMRGDGLTALTLFENGDGLTFDLISPRFREVLRMLGQAFLAASEVRSPAGEQ
jgi:hypothetical protein